MYLFIYLFNKFYKDYCVVSIYKKKYFKVIWTRNTWQLSQYINCPSFVFVEHRITNSSCEQKTNVIISFSNIERNEWSPRLAGEKRTFVYSSRHLLVQSVKHNLSPGCMLKMKPEIKLALKRVLRCGHHSRDIQCLCNIVSSGATCCYQGKSQYSHFKFNVWHKIQKQISACCLFRNSCHFDVSVQR